MPENDSCRDRIFRIFLSIFALKIRIFPTSCRMFFEKNIFRFSGSWGICQPNLVQKHQKFSEKERFQKHSSESMQTTLRNLILQRAWPGHSFVFNSRWPSPQTWFSVQFWPYPMAELYTNVLWIFRIQIGKYCLRRELPPKKRKRKATWLLLQKDLS